MDSQPLDFEKPIFELQKQLDSLISASAHNDIDVDAEVSRIKEKLHETKKRIYQNLTPWQRIQIARHTQRPFCLDYVENCFENFVELHGDRHIGDDPGMPGGFATTSPNMI